MTASASKYSHQKTVEVNTAYFPLFDNPSRYKVLKGGAGSGKSYAVAQVELAKLLQEKHRLLCLRKVQRTLRESVFSLFCQVLNDWCVPYEKNKIELSISLPNGSQIIMMGLDDVEKLKSVAGITRIFIEEATEITAQDFNQIDLRLRGAHLNDPSITLAFNPIDRDNWVYSRFFEGSPENTLILETTYKDNSFLDDQYKSVLEGYKERDFNYYKIYCLGEWGVASEGLVFTDFTLGWYEGKARTAYGLDFGYSPDPLALVSVHLQGDTLYLREHIYRNNMDADMIKEAVAEAVPRGIDCICDHRQDLIDVLFKAGVNARQAMKGKDSIDTGIKTMKQFKLVVHPDSFNLIKELKYYRYKEDKDGNPIGGKYTDVLNHAIDAARYATAYMVHVPKVKYLTYIP